MDFNLPTNILNQIRKRHLIVWVLVSLDFIFFTSVEGSFISEIAWLCLLLINFSFSYYTLLLYVWPGIFKAKWQSFLLLLFVISCFLGIYYIQIEIITPKLGGESYLQGKPIKLMLNKFILNFSYIVFASLGSYYNWNGIKQIREQTEVENNIINRELQFLRNQFHSHLTFNFLNFCYNKIRKHSLETAMHVEQFSEILRYSLKESPDKVVSLNKEIDFIKSYIALQKCITSDCNIKLTSDLNVGNRFILPKILIVFVENSLRYGIFHDAAFPIEIDIQAPRDLEIVFKIKNRKKSSQYFVDSSMSLQNIKNVLQLFYGSEYNLTLLETEDTFSCELRINSIFIN